MVAAVTSHRRLLQRPAVTSVEQKQGGDEKADIYIYIYEDRYLGR